MFRFLILSLILIISSPCFAGVNLDGTDDYVNYGDITTFDGATNFVVGFLMKLDSQTASDRIIHKWGDNALEQSFLISLSGSASDEIRFAMSNTTPAYLICDTTNANLSNGVWYYIVVVWDGGNTVGFHVNGEPTTSSCGSSTSMSVIKDGTGHFTIGEQIDSGQDSIDGIIDEISIWNSFTSWDEFDHLARSKIKRMSLQISPSNLLFYEPTDSYAEGAALDGFSFTDYISGLTGTANDGANNSGMLAEPEYQLTYP